VTQWAAGLGMKRMKMPETTAAASGASTINRKIAALIGMSALHAVNVFNIDAAVITEEHHQYRETNGGFRRRHRKYEKYKNLPGRSFR